jgi:hypothetical protein
MARGIVRGENVYLRNGLGEVGVGVMGMVYPPATGFAVLPLAFLPDFAGRVVWFLTMNAVLVFGLRALVRCAAPRAPDYVWMIGAALIVFSAGIRWGMMLLQGAPFMLGLLGFFFAALHGGRHRVALGIGILATSFKMTLALPFLGLFLLHRHFLATALCGGVWALLNGLGFLRMGSAAFATYQHNVAIFEAKTPGNINGPDPWMNVALPRLDWVYLFNGITGNVLLSRSLNLACAVATAGWLFSEGWRAREPAALSTSRAFLAPLVCLGSLCVYHHHYDVCLFFAPVLLTALGPASERQPRWALWMAIPLVVMIAALPIGKAQDVVELALGAEWIGLLKLAFPVALSLALLGSLVILRRHLVVKTQSGESLGAVGA